MDSKVLGKIGLSVAILAGGKSSRMGQDKSLVEIEGRRMLDIMLAEFKGLSDDIFIISGNKEAYSYTNLPVYPDTFSGVGPLAGIHSALIYAKHNKVLVLSCDMPFARREFATYLFDRSETFDVVVPVHGVLYEPLFAVYDKGLASIVESHILNHDTKVISFYSEAKICQITEAEIEMFLSPEIMFFNVNTPDDLEHAVQINRLGLKPSVTAVDAVLCKNGRLEPTMLLVPSEEEINIFVNDTLLVSSRLSPSRLKEYVVGFLFTEGIIYSRDDIEDMRLEGKNAYVKLSYPIHKEDIVLTSGCFGGRSFRRMREDLPVVSSNFSVSLGTVLKRMEDFLHTNRLYGISGGIHAAALSTKDDLLFVCEDIGRHNAVDKVIGWGLENNVKDAMLLVTGRISSEMAIKAIYFSVPIIVSLTSPSNVAIELCKSSDVTLIGYAKMNTCKIYASKHRVTEVF